MARRGGEFAPLGAVGLHAAGVPVRRAREIEAARAWTKVAGETAARRVRLLELTRGVMWLEAADRAWLNAIRPDVPKLARALGRQFPGLAVKKIRIRLAGAGPEAALEATVAGGGSEESG